MAGKRYPLKTFTTDVPTLTMFDFRYEDWTCEELL